MDKFIVSARKYRPQLFDAVVGQSHITTTLKNAIKNNQLAHAFLFCGPRGVGKTTCARILAKTINCENRTKDGEACNTCNSCVSFNEGISLNIHELDAASNNSVDDIRTLVDQVRFAPQAGKYKVYIIDEVHMLSASAFNAFLKTLEEPPPYAIFILATTEKHKILPTILSRCQIFDFKRISINDTIQHLEEICDKEGIRADQAALQVIAIKSEGCMRDALSILDKIVSFSDGELTYAGALEHLNILDADYYFRLMDCMLAQDLSGAMLLYDDINRKGFEGDLVLNGFSEFIRNLLVCKDAKAAVLLETVESLKNKYVEMAGKTPPSLLISALNILNESEINYKAARNKRLHVELALVKLCYLQQAIELSQDADNPNKKKIAETALAFRTAAIHPLKKGKEKNITGKQSNGSKQDNAKLVIETSVLREEKPVYNPPAGNPVPESNTGNQPAAATHTSNAQGNISTRLSALDKIRKQVKTNGNNGTATSDLPIQSEKLQQAWDEYAAKLKAEKNPAGQNFDMAELRIQDDNSFIALVTNNIQFRFIEQEGLKVSQFLREKLHNTQLQLYIVMEENKEMKAVGGAPLTAREQFLKMAGQYPLVKELKDRLRLELDY